MSEENNNTPFLSFADGMNRQSQMLFAILPLLPPKWRFPALFLSKLFECRECFRNQKRFDNEINQNATSYTSPDLSMILQQIQPLLNASQQSQISEIKNLMDALQLYRTMQSFQNPSDNNDINNDDMLNSILKSSGIDPNELFAMKQNIENESQYVSDDPNNNSFENSSGDITKETHSPDSVQKSTNLVWNNLP